MNLVTCRPLMESHSSWPFNSSISYPSGEEMRQYNSWAFVFSYLIDESPPDLKIALPTGQGQGSQVGQAVTDAAVGLLPGCKQ